MLVHLAMMLSTVHGWMLPSDDKAHDASLSSHESAITGGVDGARDRRQLRPSSCDGSWSARPLLARVLPPFLRNAAPFVSAAYGLAFTYLLAAVRSAPLGRTVPQARQSWPTRRG